MRWRIASVAGRNGSFRSGGGGVRTASGPIMNEKFYESHVFGVPWEVMVVDQPFLARWGCEGGGAGLFYVSEPDPLWHNDFRDQGSAAQSSMVGIWGPLYPRQGRAFHGSDVVASALLSYRAMDLTAGVDGKEIQLGYPTQTSCMTPGADPQSLGLQQRQAWHRRQVSLGLLEAGYLLHSNQLKEDRCSINTTQREIYSVSGFYGTEWGADIGLCSVPTSLQLAHRPQLIRQHARAEESSAVP